MTERDAMTRLLRLAADGDVDAARELFVTARRRGDAVRAALSTAGGQAGDAATVQAVVDRYEALQEADAELRALAVAEIAILELPATLLLPAVELAVDDPDERVRAAAFEALEVLCWPTRAAPLAPDAAVALLASGLLDASDRVRDRASGAFFVAELGTFLHELPEPRRAPTLQTALLERLGESEATPQRERARALVTEIEGVVVEVTGNIMVAARGTVLVPATRLYELAPSAVWAWLRLPRGTDVWPLVSQRELTEPSSLLGYGLERVEADTGLGTRPSLHHAEAALDFLRPVLACTDARVDALLDACARHRNFPVRIRALRLLAERHGIAGARRWLAAALVDSVASVRSHALGLLMRHPDHGVRAEVALRHASDPSNATRRVLLDALIHDQLDAQRVPGLVSALLHDAHLPWRIALLQWLVDASVDLHPLRGDLAGLRVHGDRRVRALAGRVLARLESAPS